MSLADLKCVESICTTNDCCWSLENKEILMIGKENCHEYKIYLKFELLPYFQIKVIQQAKLILFKIPQIERENQMDYYNGNNEYIIYPLLDFFSVYIGMYSEPRIVDELGISFRNNGCCSYTEVDITDIVNAWYDENIEEKGLLLMGSGTAGTICYASDEYQWKGMRPILRLIYQENNFCQAMSQAPCTVNIQ
ncbi:MAG: DNRLRE domain-containing protein [Lachnospiraceae bacterium]|nr:DNRLRE domain-containing protein [Lachnospiraceae bacterium]